MFWDIENISAERIALIDDYSGKNYSYKDLLNETGKLHKVFRNGKKSLVFIFCDNSALSVVSYIASLKNGHAVYLANSKMDSSLKEKLIEIYKPDFILSINAPVPGLSGYDFEKTNDGLFVYTNRSGNYEINNDLALLLSTSGTTGSPKLVRLSYNNIQSNAEAVSQYLEIDENERPVTSLPMSYSYGLSVINSHLLMGASVFCTEKSMVMRNFWESFNLNKCTSFAGVPYNFHMLRRLQFDKMKLPSLKTITQAGGSLGEELIKYFNGISKEKGIRFYVMYGQTEAAPRISYVPYHKLNEKIGSIGIPIPGGSVKIYSGGKQVDKPGQSGELIYSGPNVMMGYAESGKDLIKGDERSGILRTGDLAYKDNEGYIYITGRKKRFIKLFGLRINLDEVEKMIENNFGIAAACFGSDDKLKILLQSKGEDISGKVSAKIISIYKIHKSVLRIKSISSIPVNASGKRDYKKIREIEI